MSNAQTMPYSNEDHQRLFDAQLASVQRGDETIAGTNLPTDEYGWYLLDGIVVGDESGKDVPILRQRSE